MASCLTLCSSQGHGSRGALAGATNQYDLRQTADLGHMFHLKFKIIYKYIQNIYMTNDNSVGEEK